MTDFKPIMISLVIIIIAGIITPFVLGFFINVDNITTSPLADGLADVITEGYEVEILGLSINLNIFGWLPDVLETEFSESIKYMGLLPDFVLISLLIFIFVSFGYGILRIIRG